MIYNVDIFTVACWLYFL